MTWYWNIIQDQDIAILLDNTQWRNRRSLLHGILALVTILKQVHLQMVLTKWTNLKTIQGTQKQQLSQGLHIDACNRMNNDWDNIWTETTTFTHTQKQPPPQTAAFRLQKLKPIYATSTQASYNDHPEQWIECVCCAHNVRFLLVPD